MCLWIFLEKSSRIQFDNILIQNTVYPKAASLLYDIVVNDDVCAKARERENKGERETEGE